MGAGNRSEDTQWLDEAVSHHLALMGQISRTVTKRRSQMGVLDDDSTSDDSLGKLWDNKGDISSWSYVEHAGPK